MKVNYILMDELGSTEKSISINICSYPDLALLWVTLNSEIERVISEQTEINFNNVDIGITNLTRE